MLSESNPKDRVYMKPWEYFPEGVSLEWTVKLNSVWVRLVDTKNNYVLDRVEHPYRKNYDYMQKIMQIFVTSLIENNVI